MMNIIYFVKRFLNNALHRYVQVFIIIDTLFIIIISILYVSVLSTRKFLWSF